FAAANNAVGVADKSVKKAAAEGEAAAAPKDSISGAGITPADKICVAFDQLTAMIDALPALGSLGDQMKNVAIDAGKLGKEAVKAGSGQKGQFTPEEIEQKTQALERLLPSLRKGAETASGARQNL